VLKFVIDFGKSMLITLPSRKSLTISWNFGRILGIILVFQIITGIFLVFYLIADGGLAFLSVQSVIVDSVFALFLRIFHFNGASLFFIFLYLHIFKGLFFISYRLREVWMSGLTIFLFLIAEAFIGYVLLWRQMSFWAAAVITSLLRVIPIWGPTIVSWIWGGFGVIGFTIKFFFTVHFLLPWVVLVIIIIHLIFLHDSGSTSSIYCHGDYDKIKFFPNFWNKDSYNFLFWLLFFVVGITSPFVLGDGEIFLEANPITRPIHIVPEWYFLFAYAILRAIPNKLLGVIALVMSICFFYFFGVFKNIFSTLAKTNKFLVSTFVVVSVILSWLGQCLVEEPFRFLSPVFSIIYFFLVFLLFVNFILSKFLFSYTFIII
jgi:ubiquinol-cytochrome c reductase cytochrome b subunit